jgi:glycosyltransferase involved in cell wall biosynthesis
MPEIIPNLVSTIIPVYNRPQMVKKAVESVLSQSYRPIEIILVDDGSTDETPKVLDQMALEQPDIIRVIHKENGGPGLAREAGRLAARGEFIQYLDSDDWLLPDKFKTQVQALREHPECGIAYGISRLVNEKGNILQEPSKWTGRRYEYLFPALLVDRWWHTHTPLYRRKVSDAAGPWPKQRPEDWDLETRMGALETRLIFCDEVVSCQRDHSSDARVSRGKWNLYLLDEAWFLPRLYQCALKAGVRHDTPEMQHFSRWAFYLARQLGEMGKLQAADEMVKLSRRSSTGPFRILSLYLAGVRFLGWINMNRIYKLASSLIGRPSGKKTMESSWAG